MAMQPVTLCILALWTRGSVPLGEFPSRAVIYAQATEMELDAKCYLIRCCCMSGFLTLFIPPICHSIVTPCVFITIIS